MGILSVDSADLFIFYPPGARGDFLAAILKDDLHKQYKNFSINPPEDYQKVHWIEDMKSVRVDLFKTKIKIRMLDIEEYLTVTRLWQQKIYDQPWTNILAKLLQNEKDSSAIDHSFDHIVDFKNLYSAAYIKDLYQKINHRELGNDSVREIQYNIDLQPWITCIKNKP
jgi:hypothetical protein